MWKHRLHGFLQEDTGQDLIEYALLLAFISLVCVAVVFNIPTAMSSIWSGTINAVSDAIVALH